MFAAVSLIFWGLICHVKMQNGTERAVFVIAPQHQAKLVVALNDLKNQNQVTNFLGGGMTVVGTPVMVEFFIGKGKHFQFGGLGKGYPTVDDTIPHLTDTDPAHMGLTDGTTVAPEIPAKTTSQHILAYFDYSGGTVAPIATCTVKWKAPTKPANCSATAINQTGVAALSVRFIPDAGDIMQLMDVDGNLLDLNSNAVVHVQNLPPINTHQGYKEYLWLDDGNCMADLDMSAGCQVVLPPELTQFLSPSNVPASKVTILNVTSPECSNSQFP
ncbi:MAG TPA: hypothetical protein VEZ11_12435 [Thermoanaerobaculia bacterium]|nr:hypothetical protein [Thermoanaerobaculia bacterium]